MVGCIIWFVDGLKVANTFRIELPTSAMIFHRKPKPAPQQRGRSPVRRGDQECTNSSRSVVELQQEKAESDPAGKTKKKQKKKNRKGSHTRISVVRSSKSPKSKKRPRWNKKPSFTKVTATTATEGATALVQQHDELGGDSPAGTEARDDSDSDGLEIEIELDRDSSTKPSKRDSPPVSSGYRPRVGMLGKTKTNKKKNEKSSSKSPSKPKKGITRRKQGGAKSHQRKISQKQQQGEGSKSPKPNKKRPPTGDWGDSRTQSLSKKRPNTTMSPQLQQQQRQRRHSPPISPQGRTPLPWALPLPIREKTASTSSLALPTILRQDVATDATVAMSTAETVTATSVQAVNTSTKPPHHVKGSAIRLSRTPRTGEFHRVRSLDTIKTIRMDMDGARSENSKDLSVGRVTKRSRSTLDKPSTPLRSASGIIPCAGRLERVGSSQSSVIVIQHPPSQQTKSVPSPAGKSATTSMAQTMTVDGNGKVDDNENTIVVCPRPSSRKSRQNLDQEEQVELGEEIELVAMKSITGSLAVRVWPVKDQIDQTSRLQVESGNIQHNFPRQNTWDGTYPGTANDDDTTVVQLKDRSGTFKLALLKVLDKDGCAEWNTPLITADDPTNQNILGQAREPNNANRSAGRLEPLAENGTVREKTVAPAFRQFEKQQLPGVPTNRRVETRVSEGTGLNAQSGAQQLGSIVADASPRFGQQKATRAGNSSQSSDSSNKDKASVVKPLTHETQVSNVRLVKPKRGWLFRHDSTGKSSNEKSPTVKTEKSDNSKEKDVKLVIERSKLQREQNKLMREKDELQKKLNALLERQDDLIEKQIGQKKKMRTKTNAKKHETIRRKQGQLERREQALQNKQTQRQSKNVQSPPKKSQGLRKQLIPYGITVKKNQKKIFGKQRQGIRPGRLQHSKISPRRSRMTIFEPDKRLQFSGLYAAATFP